MPFRSDTLPSVDTIDLKSDEHSVSLDDLRDYSFIQ